MSRELFKRILLTLGIVAIVRAMAMIPIPGVNIRALMTIFNTSGSSGFTILLDGSFKRVTILALGITPYVTASVITVVVLYLLKFRKGVGESAVNTARYTIGLTIVLCLIQSYGIAKFLENLQAGGNGQKIVPYPGFGIILLTMVALTTATLILVWLAHMISKKGVGNGVCIFILLGIVSHWLNYSIEWSQVILHTVGVGRLILSNALYLGLIILCVYIIGAGQKFYLKSETLNSGTNHQDIFFHVNTMGIFPIVFTSSLIALAFRLPGYIPFLSQNAFFSNLENSIQKGYLLFWIIFLILLPIVAYFWVAVAYNPNQLLRTLRRFIEPNHLAANEERIKQQFDERMSKATLVFVLFLFVVALFPLVQKVVLNAENLSAPASINIVIFVAIVLSIAQQVKSFQMMREQRVVSRESDTMMCENCKEPVNEKEEFCTNCGVLYGQKTCSAHAEEAVGICVVCQKALCPACAVNYQGRIRCQDHADLDIIERWVTVYSAQSGLEAQLLKEKLERENIPCHVVSNTVESMYGTHGFWDISTIVPMAVFRGLGGGETKVMVPVGKYGALDSLNESF